ncbi:MAG: hypothetical protein A2V88_10530 [Elusimicrobia bacterium RBG_16_66_12]|nr:MAG: hypothetical protein A2V88_10530 [Elusimicrobia bacterium RBG_16_66_12]
MTPRDPGRLKIVGLSLSNRCTNECIFCGDVRMNVPVLNAGQIATKLEGYRRSGYNGIDISSKEFTLRPDALEILRHARGLGFDMIHLVTNGHVFARSKRAAEFLDAGITDLTLSLHSDSSETESLITGNPSSFSRKLASIESVLRYVAERKSGLVFSVNTVMTPLTASRLDRVMDFVASRGVRRHNLFFPRIQGHMLDAFERTVPRFSEVSGPLSKGLDQVDARGVACSVLDVPPCVIAKHARRVCARLSQEDLFNISGGDAGSERRRDAGWGKVKGEPCRACPLAEKCEGVPAAYAERRGWLEFVPPPPESQPLGAG